MTELDSAAALTERPCPFTTFYSFKGGVGRSMAVINVAGIMASRGFRILVVDMDLEAPGLSFLANPDPRGDESRPLQAGFTDFMLDAVVRGAESDLFQLSAADSVGRYSAPYELPEEFRRSPDGSLHIMPAGQIDDGYAARLTRLDLPSLYREGTGLALIQAFKQVVQDSRLFDYVFIDSRTGFSDESGICTRDLADCLVVVSGLNQQNVEGTARFLATLRHATEERKPLEVVLSPIPNGEDALVEQREEQARVAFSEAWGAPVGTDLHIPYHPQLALTEEPHIFRRRKGYLFDAYHRIERSVFGLIGETWNEVLDAAMEALKDKKYITAEAYFRRVSKLADTRDWVDLQILALTPDIAWVTDPDANAVFDFLLEQANSTTKRHFGRRIGNEASRRRDREPDIAKALYERALEANADDANNLGNFATFLSKERKNLDAAEAMFQRALKADPNDAINLGNFAIFLKRERKDLDAAEAMYQRALKVDPNEAISLSNFASFIWSAKKDLDPAEAMHQRALKAAPNDAGPVGIYANFIWEARKDLEAAEAMYQRALKADPNHANNLGNYARLCLSIGRVTEGLGLVDRALAIQAPAHSPEALDAELWMYIACCGGADRRHDALRQLRRLVEVHAITTDDWDFTGVIEQARTMDHPESEWLPTLADVLGRRLPPTALADWPAWRAAAPDSTPDQA